jgi:hypothetical protein
MILQGSDIPETAPACPETETVSAHQFQYTIRRSFHKEETDGKQGSKCTLSCIRRKHPL